ncbi:hypothetical protein AVEN_203828-1 [Araneus ventricosus]|uniref:Uncharacterized protein n=1 Tax=Araneus ventricosus TaxID=182803 RepID=A0A4Y2HWV2_ARAVE|nr:hypothetical protein AVEN_203828-1 [Araneus ventricosus]
MVFVLKFNSQRQPPSLSCSNGPHHRKNSFHSKVQTMDFLSLAEFFEYVRFFLLQSNLSRCRKSEHFEAPDTSVDVSLKSGLYRGDPDVL